MNSIENYSLSSELQNAIHNMGFQKPSPIQAQAIPLLTGDPTDFLGMAATGTGKTAAFGIPLLERISSESRKVQSLILCPTRELALQVTDQINQLGAYKGIEAMTVYGGSGYREQIQGLKNGTRIVVGTPGRVVDHLKRGRLKLNHMHTLILDEADEMISMGFKEDLETILEKSNQAASNTWFFSATMNPQVRKVANSYLNEPKKVQVNQKTMLSSTVEQYYAVTKESTKLDVLCKFMDMHHDFYGLIFAQTKSLVKELTAALNERGYRADSLHGDKAQKERESTLSQFRSKKLDLLVCTDVASRGIDVKKITHVINYSLPRELDSYVHRIGRTARSGEKGIAISLLTPSQKKLLPKIEKMTNTKLQEAGVPSRKTLGKKKVQKQLDQFSEQKDGEWEKALELIPQDWQEKIKGMSPEEVAARFLKMNLPEIFAPRKSSPLSNPDEQSASSRPRKKRSDHRGQRKKRPSNKKHPSKKTRHYKG